MPAIETERRTLLRPSWLGETLDTIASTSRLLFVEGLPTGFIGKRFRLDPGVALRTLPSGDRVLRFGTSGLSNAIAIDLDSGHVVEVIDVPTAPVVFVNSSLSQFVSTIEALVKRFPYYDSDSDQSEIDGAAAHLMDLIRSIDPAAAEPDRYWSTFVDDALMGDLTTEAILEAIRRSEQ